MKHHLRYTLIPALGSLRRDVLDLLQENNLPVSDLDEHKLLFALVDEAGRLAGSAGLEIFAPIALVRSVSIQKELQGQGLGRQLNRQLEAYARSKGIQTLYLLTTTAAAFYEKEGYVQINRENAPPSIRSSSEFQSVCPSGAALMKKELLPKKKLLFVCIENSNRSQMSQAFARLLGGETVEAFSAGSRPSGIVNPKAIAAMKELGYDLNRHESKSLDEVKQYAPFDVVVTMGCGDACPWMPAKKFVDWQIPDPKNMEPAEFNQVRDLIRDKVNELLHSLD